MQPTAVLWKQDSNGNDELVPTRDIITAPPLVEIAPRQKQVIRLALRAVEPKDKERQYRLLVREVQPARSEGGVGLQFSINLSIPVFAYSNASAGNEALAATLRRTGNGFALTLKNDGSNHVQFREVKLLNETALVAKSGQLSYVLPGAARTLEVPLAAGVTQSSLTTKQLKAEIVTSTGTVTRDLSLNTP
jgi:fimbrial chaperone protein